MDDLGAPSSYLALADGVPVYSSDGEELGKVEHVLAEPEEDIFDGFVIDTSVLPGGHRFVDAPEVEAIYERGVVLKIDAAAAEDLPEPSANPGVLEVGRRRCAPEPAPAEAATGLGPDFRQLLRLYACGVGGLRGCRLQAWRGRLRGGAAGRVWNARTPARYPDARRPGRRRGGRRARPFASPRVEGMRIGVRSGGHSWAGNHVRDGGLLLDVSRAATRSTIDARRDDRGRPARAAAATSCSTRSPPRTSSSRPATAPASRLGGYLLQGGFGWNGRVHGPACMSVEAIDVVTADGELVRADADETRRPLLGGARGRARASSVPSPASTCASSRGRGRRQRCFTSTRSTRSRRSSRWAARDRPRRSPREMEMMLVHPPRRSRASRRSRSPDRCSSTARRRRRAALGDPRDLPGARAARRRRSPTSPAQTRGPLRRGPRLLPGRPPLRGRQHVDARAGRRAAARPARGSPRRSRRRRRTCCG